MMQLRATDEAEKMLGSLQSIHSSEPLEHNEYIKVEKVENIISKCIYTIRMMILTSRSSVGWLSLIVFIIALVLPSCIYVLSDRHKCSTSVCLSHPVSRNFDFPKKRL